MATPTQPAPEVGTRIVLVGSTRDQPLAIVVEEKAALVAQQGGGVRRLTSDGEPVWINFENVLYLEEVHRPVAA